jgi:formate-dependent nitrite reductase membrane component NrfD
VTTTSSYYGQPVIKPPVWQARDIAGYFFAGGLAGASSVLAAGAELTGNRHLATVTKFGALAGLAGSLFGLIHDLGRPERFLNMLRVAKPTSPMSVGSWLLAAYGPQAGVAAATAATGRLPRLGRVATLGAGLTGPAVASYTAALIADTAVPAWHDGYRELPFVFTGSAATAAGGLGMLATPVAQAGPARRAAAAGAACELVAFQALERRLGALAEPYRRDHAGRLLRAARVLTAGGAATGVLLGGRSRAAAAISGAALLAGSACTRFGIFHAGMASARDPRYTVAPQQQRLQAGERAAACGERQGGAVASPGAGGA